MQVSIYRPSSCEGEKNIDHNTSLKLANILLQEPNIIYTRVCWGYFLPLAFGRRWSLKSRMFAQGGRVCGAESGTQMCAAVPITASAVF